MGIDTHHTRTSVTATANNFNTLTPVPMGKRHLNFGSRFSRNACTLSFESAVLRKV